VTTIIEPTRTPDIEFAEKSVLGTMITSQRAAENMLDVLDREECFGDPGHRAVYAAIRYIVEEGTPLEPATVLTRLVAAEHGVWHSGQAGVILGDLIHHASPAYAVHAQTVLRAARRQHTLEAVESARGIASAPGFDAAESGDLIRKLIDDALTGPQDTDAGSTAADLFDTAMDRLESPDPPGVIQFPWADLRELVPYLRPGQLCTIAARPSLGKSLLAHDLARHVSLHVRIPSVLFTMEMSRDEVMDRLLAAESGVLLSRIVEKDLDDNAWARLAATRERFHESRLIIDDVPKATLAHIRARLRGASRREPVQLAIVDYLQLMASPGGSENRQQEVSALVSGLKAIAREFRIPVVMLCQLNRLAEGRSDRRPYLSDARESGAVENDSDVAILIHRPDFHDHESPRAGEADLIVDKNRNGRRGTVTVGFQGHHARFVDLTKTWTASAVIGGAA
jgi:replicative DNA helicase